MKCQVDAIHSGGGVVAECFRRLQKPARFSGDFSFMGPFYIFTLSQRGGPGPPGPPESATGIEVTITVTMTALYHKIKHMPLIKLCI